MKQIFPAEEMFLQPIVTTISMKLYKTKSGKFYMRNEYNEVYELTSEEFYAYCAMCGHIICEYRPPRKVANLLG